jgi:hypothetical protein
MKRKLATTMPFGLLVRNILDALGFCIIITAAGVSDMERTRNNCGSWGGCNGT